MANIYAGNQDHLVTWLLGNLQQDLENSSHVSITPKTQVYDLYVADCQRLAIYPKQKHVLGKLITKLFPKSVSTQLKIQKDKTKEYVYKNLHFKYFTVSPAPKVPTPEVPTPKVPIANVQAPEVENSSEIELTVAHNNVLDLGLHGQVSDTGISFSSNFHIIQSDENETIYGCYSQFSTNGQRLVKEVILRSNGEWEICIALIKVNKALLGLSVYDRWSPDNVQNIFNAVERCKLCTGKPCECDNDILKTPRYVVKEWKNLTSVEDMDVFTEKRIQSKNCCLVMPFTCYSQTCVVCRKVTPVYANFPASPTPVTPLQIDPDSAYPTPVTPLQTDQDSMKQEDRSPSHLEESLVEEICSLFPSATPEMMSLLASRTKNSDSERHPICRRWDFEVIKLCLTLWDMDPGAYKVLQGGELVLPCIRTLQLYKSCCKQKTDVHDDDDETIAGSVSLDWNDIFEII